MKLSLFCALAAWICCWQLGNAKFLGSNGGFMSEKLCAMGQQQFCPTQVPITGTYTTPTTTFPMVTSPTTETLTSPITDTLTSPTTGDLGTATTTTLPVTLNDEVDTSDNHNLLLKIIRNSGADSVAKETDEVEGRARRRPARRTKRRTGGRRKVRRTRRRRRVPRRRAGRRRVRRHRRRRS